MVEIVYIEKKCLYPHHSELAEQSERSAAEKYSIITHAAYALISPLRAFRASVEMMGRKTKHAFIRFVKS